MKFTLKQARKYANFTPKEMAKLLHISKKDYVRLENFPEHTTIKQAMEISKITGVDIDKIFFA